jgi:hypothetical protein
MEGGVRRSGLPVACALGSGEGAVRLGRWHALAGQYPPRAHRSGNQLEVRWQLEGEGVAELAALVDAERECCAFVSWAISREGTDSVLTVTADPTSPDDIAGIAGLFGVA